MGSGWKPAGRHEIDVTVIFLIMPLLNAGQCGEGFQANSTGVCMSTQKQGPLCSVELTPSHSPILSCPMPRGAAVPKSVSLHPMGIAAAAGVSSGEGTFVPLSQVKAQPLPWSYLGLRWPFRQHRLEKPCVGLPGLTQAYDLAEEAIASPTPCPSLICPSPTPFHTIHVSSCT